VFSFEGRCSRSHEVREREGSFLFYDFSDTWFFSLERPVIVNFFKRTERISTNLCNIRGDCKVDDEEEDDSWTKTDKREEGHEVKTSIEWEDAMTVEKEDTSFRERDGQRVIEMSFFFHSDERDYC
jgi:hypothetical protein